MVYRIFKPRRILRENAKHNNIKKNIILEDGELMIVKKEQSNAYNNGVKSDIYIGNGVTTLENMKPAVYGDTSEEPIDITEDQSSTSETSLDNVVSGKSLGTILGSLKRAIQLIKEEFDIPVFGYASSGSSGTNGLVPAPSAGQQNYVLTGSGWKQKASRATSADYSTKTANDSADNNINNTYIKNISVTGTTLTFTKGNNSASTVALQDQNTQYPLAVKAAASSGTKITFTRYNNGTFSVNTQDTTYSNFSTASASVAGAPGLVPGPASGQQNYVLTGSGWKSAAPNATNATKATQDSGGQQINTTYIKGLAVNGTTLTITKGNNSTSSIQLRDEDTQYPLAIKQVTANQTTLTFTHYNGNTSTVSTKDTTYSNFSTASASVAGAPGLVPAPAAGQQNYILTGSGWKKSAGGAATADWALEAETSDYLGGFEDGEEVPNSLKDNVILDFGYEG